jgi:hypothetical protein
MQTLAERWFKTHHPYESRFREAGGEWRERPISEAQAVFCDRHGIRYDMNMTRGIITSLMDQYVLQVKIMRNLHQ